MMSLFSQCKRDHKASLEAMDLMNDKYGDIRKGNSNSNGGLYRSSGAEVGDLILHR